MPDCQQQYIPPQDYRFNFEAEIDAVVARYPETFSNIFFVSAPWQTARSNLKFECFGPAWKRHEGDPQALKIVEQLVLRTVEKGNSCAVIRKYNDMRFIVIYFPNAMNSRRSSDMVFTFDHEVGHHLVPSGYLMSAEDDDRLTGESAADAFASLRCLQRFGATAGLKLLTDHYIDSIAHPLNSHIKGDWVHLTAAVINQIIRDEPQGRFEDLPAAATVEKAEYYAKTFSPKGNVAKRQWDTLNGIVSSPSPVTPSPVASVPVSASSVAASRSPAIAYSTTIALPPKDLGAIAIMKQEDSVRSFKASGSRKKGGRSPIVTLLLMAVWAFGVVLLLYCFGLMFLNPALLQYL